MSGKWLNMVVNTRHCYNIITEVKL
jgi:hypothetical protein